MSEYKVCPYCSEEIKEAAIICRYCGNKQPGFEGRTNEPNKKTTSEAKSSGKGNEKQFEKTIWQQGRSIAALFTIFGAIAAFFNNMLPDGSIIWSELFADLIFGSISIFLVFWFIGAGYVYVWRHAKWLAIILVILPILGFPIVIAFSLLPNSLASPAGSSATSNITTTLSPTLKALSVFEKRETEEAGLFTNNNQGADASSEGLAALATRAATVATITLPDGKQCIRFNYVKTSQVNQNLCVFGQVGKIDIFPNRAEYYFYWCGEVGCTDIADDFKFVGSLTNQFKINDCIFLQGNYRYSETEDIFLMHHDETDFTIFTGEKFFGCHFG